MKGDSKILHPLKNIEDRKEDFTVDEHIITEIISLIKPFRKSANLNAHSIIIVSDEKGILDFRYRAFLHYYLDYAQTLSMVHKPFN